LNFYCIGNIKIFVFAGDEEKIEPQRTQRPQSFFFRKAKNTNHSVDISSPLRTPGSLRFTVFFFLENQNLSFFLSSADKDSRKMTEEEAESAEIIF
jgi:hypothetical protein